MYFDDKFRFCIIKSKKLSYAYSNPYDFVVVLLRINDILYSRLLLNSFCNISLTFPNMQ